MFFNRFKKVRDSVSDEFFKAGLCVKTLKRSQIRNKSILFLDIFLDELTIIFEDRSVIKFEIIKDKFFEKQYITILEINELLYKADQITKNEFDYQKKNIEDKWNLIYDKINKKKDLKLYKKLKHKFTGEVNDTSNE